MTVVLADVIQIIVLFVGILALQGAFARFLMNRLDTQVKECHHRINIVKNEFVHKDHLQDALTNLRDEVKRANTRLDGLMALLLEMKKNGTAGQ